MSTLAASCLSFRRSAWVQGLLLASIILAHGAGFAKAEKPPIIIGQSCDLSSSTAGRVKEFIKGADAYIESVNRSGGVYGRPVQFIRYDDGGFKPDKALENAKRLVEEDGAFALFGVGSAPATAAILPYALEKGVPVLGSLSGADSLRKDNPMMFHTRASFGEEIARLAAHLRMVGMKRVAALAADLPIGREGIAALQAAAAREGLELVGTEKVATDFSNVKDAAAVVAKLSPHAVVVLAPSGPGIKLVEAVREAGYHGQLVGLSVLSSDSLYKALGDKSKGMIITQIVPFPWSSKLNLVRDYQQLMQRKKLPISIDSMEGYFSARLLVAGLKAAGPRPTRSSFTAGLEAMTDKDMGGVRLLFSPQRHVASNLVEITMVGRDGRLVN